MAGIRDNGLTPKQLKAILALTTGSTVTECAAQVGVTTRTIENWMKQPDFKAAYLKGKEQIREHGSIRITNAIDKCIDALVGNLKLKSKPSAVNRAAHILLSFGFGHCAYEDVLKQLEELKGNDADDGQQGTGSTQTTPPRGPGGGEGSGVPPNSPAEPPPGSTAERPDASVSGDGLDKRPVADELRLFDEPT